jgi:hypothetical protein
MTVLSVLLAVIGVLLTFIEWGILIGLPLIGVGCAMFAFSIVKGGPDAFLDLFRSEGS